MKLRLLTLSLISALVALPILRAQDAAKKEKEPHTELADAMEKLNDAYRKLGRQAADATKNEDSLKQVAIIKASAEAALKLEPVKKKDIPEAEQAKFIADYQAKMKEFLVTVGKLDAALKAGDNAAAVKLVEELKAHRDADHKSFKKGKGPKKA